MSDDRQLCIDIGYTHTRFALWDGQALGQFRRILTPKTWVLGVHEGEKRRQAWLKHLAGEVRAERERTPQISRIGICFPGVVSASGDIWRENTIWGFTADDLSSAQLEAALGLSVSVLNDMTAAAIRYGEDASIPGERNILVLSVSSGIGAKMYDRVRREVLLEPRGRNGEIGLAIADDSAAALENALGLKGILGNYSSGFTFSSTLRLVAEERPEVFAASKLAKELEDRSVDIEAVDRAELNALGVAGVQNGDAFCIEALTSSVRRLARVLQTIILFAAPETIVVTGGFANALGETYLATLREELSSLFQILYGKEEVQKMVVGGASDDLDNLLGLAAWMDVLSDQDKLVQIQSG